MSDKRRHKGSVFKLNEFECIESRQGRREQNETGVRNETSMRK